MPFLMHGWRMMEDDISRSFRIRGSISELYQNGCKQINTTFFVKKKPREKTHGRKLPFFWCFDTLVGSGNPSGPNFGAETWQVNRHLLKDLISRGLYNEAIGPASFWWMDQPREKTRCVFFSWKEVHVVDMFFSYSYSTFWISSNMRHQPVENPVTEVII